MTRIYALCRPEQTGLFLWRDSIRSGGQVPSAEAVGRGLDDRGLNQFEVLLDQHLHEPARFKIHGSLGWEADAHTKVFPRTADYGFPSELYCVEGAARVLLSNPYTAYVPRVTIHLVTASRSPNESLLVWSPVVPARTFTAHTHDEYGPVFELELDSTLQPWFCFKFLDEHGTPEPDFANRLWCAADGSEIWVHARAAAIGTSPPLRRSLTICTHSFDRPGEMPALHLWQPDSDFAMDVPAMAHPDGTLTFETLVFTNRVYGLMFRDSAGSYWEDDEARRQIFVKDDGEVWAVIGDGTERWVSNGDVWTLEGDHELYGDRPRADKPIRLTIADADPNLRLGPALELDVWVNHSRTLLYSGLRPDLEGHWFFRTYPEVVTSFRFRSADDAEPVARHTIKISDEQDFTCELFVVLGRAEPLRSAPVRQLFQDPPFELGRPGAWLQDGMVRFVLHCPTASSVEVVGAWTDWESRPFALRSTRDGTYWWGEIPIENITRALGRESIHGLGYKFRLNQRFMVQDPAADWVENSAATSQSQLVDHASYAWQANGWQRPGWEYLIVYQAHPNAFAALNGKRGLDAITHELQSPTGYLRDTHATALLLMPVAEYAMSDGWGYNPSFFYAVESSYGGPDALKRLVDACHARGLAVLLDVVFNHAGTGDNVLWSIARTSYFDGDTDWGAMLNFDHPQVIHFFEQNLVHFMRNYRIDGFRFDFTNVIRFGQYWAPHVKEPGSGGGEEFLQRLRRAVHGVDHRCLLMAEQFPNDLYFTSPEGPMDTQWHDAFHDRLLEACRGWDVMGALADALKAGNNSRWYELTNYPESHDEVGNSGDRVSSVAGVGRGYRMSKVAAAATLLARGIPMWFMGAEYAEWRGFSKDGRGPIEIEFGGDARSTVRRWWQDLCKLRLGNPRVQGPAPLAVSHAQAQTLAFTRGDNADLFVLLNFGGNAGTRWLADFGLPDGSYKELLNSTWNLYGIGAEGEEEHSNGGWDARLGRGSTFELAPYSVLVLERS